MGVGGMIVVSLFPTVSPPPTVSTGVDPCCESVGCSVFAAGGVNDGSVTALVALLATSEASVFSPSQNPEIPERFPLIAILTPVEEL